MLMYILKMLMISFLLTIVIEWCVALLFGMKHWRSLLIIFLVNLMTNPAAVFSYYMIRRVLLKNVYLTMGREMLIQSGLELIVIVVELLIYKSFATEKYWKIKNPMSYAIVANMMAWILGIVIQYIS